MARRKKRKKQAYGNVNGFEGLTYIGETNNLSRREREHRKSGKLGPGDWMVPLPGRETRLLREFRNMTGRLPKHNKTIDGKFRRRWW